LITAPDGARLPRSTAIPPSSSRGADRARSPLDTRALVLKDVTAVGVLSGSGGQQGVVGLLATGALDPRPLVAATVPLEGLADVLHGRRPAGAGPGPKIQVDPRL
jgi:hypothetical protein